MNTEEQPASLDIMKEQTVPANNETSASFKSSQEAPVVVHPAKVAPLTGPYGLAGDFAGHLPSSILSPQAQGFYYRGWFCDSCMFCLASLIRSLSSWSLHVSYSCGCVSVILVAIERASISLPLSMIDFSSS
jgi:hypothetical protein